MMTAREFCSKYKISAMSWQIHDLQTAIDRVSGDSPWIGEYDWGRWIVEPDFENRGKVHDWRNHVPMAVMKMWFDLGFAERLLMYYWAEKLAGSEEWE